MAVQSIDSPAPAPESRFDPDEVVGYSRSPSDVLRVLAYGVLAVVLLLVTRYAEDAVLGVERGVVDALGFLEPPAYRVLEGFAQIVAVVAGIGVLAFPFVLRRYRM